MAVQQEFDNVTIGIHCDRLFLAQVALLPWPRVDKDHWPFDEISLPEVKHIFRKPVRIYPSLWVHITQRCVLVNAVGTMISVEKDHYVVGQMLRVARRMRCKVAGILCVLPLLGPSNLSILRFPSL